MTEDAQAPVEPVTPPATDTDGDPTATGNAKVDGVLASLEGLEGRPVSEHVAVFEQAHDDLRSALATAGDAPAAPAG